MRKRNLARQKIGDLTAIRRVSPAGTGHARWLWLCCCGNEIVALSSNVIGGLTTSCGCARKSHGMSHTRIHHVWRLMKNRCSNPNNPYYGGRGITVCARWLKFEHFWEDVKDIYNSDPAYTMDRIENNRGYEPGNVRWVTWSVQVKNRRNLSQMQSNDK